MTTHIANEELSRLWDVLLTSLTNGQSLKWDATQNKWVNGTAGLSTEEVDDRVASLLVAGSNITLSYDDSASTLTISATVPPSYTDEQAQDAIAAALTDSSSITFSYDDTLNQISASIVNEAIDDRVAALLIAGTGIALTYDDTANTLTVDSSSSFNPNSILLTPDDRIITDGFGNILVA